MGEKDDYLTSYRVFFENFAATVDPEDQLPVNIAGYTITEAELPGEVLYWTTQYLTEKQCPPTLMAPLQRIILEEVKVASKIHPNEFGFNSDDSEYIALRLMQAVTARVNDVCLRYLDNSRLDTLPPPPPPSMREYRTVSSATKNVRRAMEDRHVEIGNLEALFGIETTEPTSFYAVYDGHAGSAAATYCAAHLHQYLVESPHFTRDLRQATHDAYLRTDAEFVRKNNQKRASGGSTAVSVAVRGRRLVAAWAGDSLALLAKRMRLLQLVNPHKPDRTDERERIESTGGKVMFWGTWRVNGQLAVSRAIGDAQYKPCVTARPEITVVDLDGDEDFVVVACDGLWDVVSEDAVALSVYNQLMNDPNDLKAVPKNLIRQAKKDGSEDNISIIVVFLKDPRDIVADNCPRMDLGLDNAVVNAPPFSVENEACKMVAEAGGGDCAESGDNGVSDSDSDDLGPETAVDADLDMDDDADMNPEPAPPTPPAHAVEASHVDGNLVDNVAESGEESEDEWNYYKGEGEREQNPSEEADEPPRSETPCQDNSAWESSSVDMNSSPLNPDAPVFIPGSVAGSDVLLAESPRKPLPMDDIELPDVTQFQTEAVVRPAELQDLDNCDQLNGHHNISMEGVTEHLNGNDKCEMESLGFECNVGIEQDKIKDTSLLQDFERIQKDTTDFCNIQVFQSHADTNSFNVDGDDELFERLKNKERDPMNMSFYQEKDDDTCERFGKIGSNVDLNAVQLLPDSDDEDIQPNGYQNAGEHDKENVSPDEKLELLNLEDNGVEPNNDSMRFDERSDILSKNVSNLDNYMDFNIQNTNNMQNYSNTEFECNIQQEPVVQTDTPESHKLLFEQIPEIPDGKSSELGFTNEDLLDPSESDKDARVITPQDEISQDIEMESKLDESPCEEDRQELLDELKDDQIEDDVSERTESDDKLEHEIRIENAISPEISEQMATTPEPSQDFEHDKPLSPELTQGSIIVDVHEIPEPQIDSQPSDKIKQELVDKLESNEDKLEPIIGAPEIRLEADIPNINLENDSESQIISQPADSPAQSPMPSEAQPSESPLPRDSPLPQELSLPRDSPVPSQSPLPSESPVPDYLGSNEISQPHESPVPDYLGSNEISQPHESPVPDYLGSNEISQPHESPVSDYLGSNEISQPHESPMPDYMGSNEISQPHESPVPDYLGSNETSQPQESPMTDHLGSNEISQPQESPMIDHLGSNEVSQPHESPLPRESPMLQETTLPPVSAILQEQDILPQEALLPEEESLLSRESPLPKESLVPTELIEARESPLSQEALRESSLPRESPFEQDLQTDSPIPCGSPQPQESLQRASPMPSESLIPSDSPIEKVEHSSHLCKSSLPSELEVSESPALAPSPLPSSQSPFEPPVPAEVPLPRESPLPTETPLADSDLSHPVHADEIAQPVVQSLEPVLSIEPVEACLPAESPVPIELVLQPAPTEIESSEIRPLTPLEHATESEARFTPTVPQESNEALQVEETSIALSAPAPDLVPEERLRTELVTDIDIGIPESRAQEICVPVTCEIRHDDGEQRATTPPAPALDAAPLAAAAVAAAAAAAAATAVAAKAKGSPKKSPTTPAAKSDKTASRTTLKPTASQTSASAKRPAATTPKSPATSAARAPARTPTSATKAAPAARPAAKPAAPPVKAAAPSAKPAPKPAAPARAAPAPRSAPAARPLAKAPAAKPAAPRPVPAAKPAAPRSVPAKTTAVAPAKPAAPRSAPITRPPISAAAKTKEAKPKPAAPAKPLANGDVKMATKPAPRPAAARTAPRPTPRPAAPASPAAPLTKPAAPKPAARVPLDKQSKDLANKRTAKAAPPRTAATKAPGGVKSVPKRPLDNKKEALANGGAVGKAPPSPPPPADSLLPDVIA